MGNQKISDEPLNSITVDDLLSCAQYAIDNNLLDTPRWKRLKSIAKQKKKMTRLINQSKLRSYRISPKYMFGLQIPRDYKQEIDLDIYN